MEEEREGAPLKNDLGGHYSSGGMLDQVWDQFRLRPSVTYWVTLFRTDELVWRVCLTAWAGLGPADRGGAGLAGKWGASPPRRWLAS